MKKINIAVDGPAGSGKSTIFEIVATKINYQLLDTGLIYRGFAWYCLNSNINFTEAEIINKLKEFSVQFVNNQVLINHQQIGNELFDKDVISNVKYVANLKEVRERINDIIREIVKPKGFFVLGRDITSVVLLDAELKIYLDSSVDIRAARRLKQNILKNVQPQNLDQIKQMISERDLTDSSRSIAPLVKTPDAWVIYNESDNINGLVNQIIEKITQIIS